MLAMNVGSGTETRCLAGGLIHRCAVCVGGSGAAWYAPEGVHGEAYLYNPDWGSLV